MLRIHFVRPISLLITLLLTFGIVGSVLPQPDAPGLQLEAGGSITLTLNGATATRLDATGFGLDCQQMGTVDFTVSGSGDIYTFTPATALIAGDVCTVSVFMDGADSTADESDFLVSVSLSFTALGGEATPEPTAEVTPPVISSACDMPDTAIGAIQGSGASFALSGTQTIEGIVTGDFEDDANADTFDLRGFYVQDAGDGDPATSDGIFVFTDATSSFVNPGDRVQVTGTISEFPASGASETQLRVADAQSVIVCSTGNLLPAPIEVSLPFSAVDAQERYESMLVTLPQSLSVTELFQLGRHGELVLSSGGRLAQPTNIAAPGAAAQAVLAANSLNRIIIDDTYLTQNPDPIVFPAPELTAQSTVRGGYSVTGVTGIFTQSRGRAQNNGETTVNYRVRVINPLNFDSTPNPRPTALPDVGAATLTVASFNVLNYFNTFTNDATGCFIGGNTAPGNCRGANSQVEYDRQRAKTVSAIIALDADIIGLVELENDDDANQAIADLVAGINAVAGTGTYQFIDTGRIGRDAIRVGLIYKPATVTPSHAFAVLDDVDPYTRNTRPPLAQLWTEIATGEQFYVVVNHMKSKGSCPSSGTNADSGDGQGCWNADRVKAADALLNWINTNSYFATDPDVLLIGDLNAYAQEDPITMLAADGFTNLIAQFIGVDAYSYVFDGAWGYLDYALANSTLMAQVTGVGEFHINADEPSVLDYNVEFKTPRQINLLYSPDFYRVSDHDPVLIGLDLEGGN